MWVETARREGREKKDGEGARRTRAREKLSSEQQKVDRKKDSTATCYCPKSVCRDLHKQCNQSLKIEEARRNRQVWGERDPGAGRDERTRAQREGEVKREGAEPEPLHLTSTPTALKFLSAADCVLHVFLWTWDRKLTCTVKRPHKENICRRVVARKRIDRVIILSKVEGK